MKDYLGAFLADVGKKYLEGHGVPYHQNPQNGDIQVGFEGFEGTTPPAHWKFFVAGTLPWDVVRQSLAPYREAVLALVEAFEERAAIAEYCSGLPRDAAEALAWQCVLRSE